MVCGEGEVVGDLYTNNGNGRAGWWGRDGGRRVYAKRSSYVGCGEGEVVQELYTTNGNGRAGWWGRDGGGRMDEPGFERKFSLVCSGSCSAQQAS